MKIVIYRKSPLIGTHGGIEKVISAFANAFTARGHEVVIITRDKRKGGLFFPVNPKVRLINLHDAIAKKWNLFRQGIYEICRRRKHGTAFLQKHPFFDREKNVSDVISAEIKKINPDIILSSGIVDSIDIVHGQSVNPPIIQMLHCLPSFYLRAKNELTRQNFSEVFDKINQAQVLLPSYIENFRLYYNGPITAIGNSVEQTEQNVSYGNDKQKYSIIYMARLDKSKQQDLLIKAFALLAKRFPDWEVNLWGNSEKSKKQELQHLISKLKLENQVFLRGITKEAQKELLKSDICAFPSAFEGFSLALTEAMAVGLPCIGLKTASCVNELIEDGINGYLADNTPEDFADKLEKLMTSAETRRRFGLAGKEKIKQYAPENIWKQWDDLIKEIVEKKHA